MTAAGRRVIFAETDGRAQMTKMNTFQSAVLADLFDRLPIGEEVDTLNFSLSGNFTGKFFAAFAEIKNVAEKASIVFTLPAYTNHVFFGLTRSKEPTVARLLANIEDYERENSLELSFGEVVVIPDNTGSGDQHPHALLLTRTTTSRDLESVPDRTKIQSKVVTYFFAIPLNREELELRNKSGHDALIDRFVSTEKQLFFF